MHVSRLFLFRFVLLALTPVLFCGCGDSRLPVSGTVTLNDKPLALGTITFVPASDKKANSAGGAITEGKFSLPAGKGLLPGKYRVSITPIQKTGRQIRDSISGKMEDERAHVNYREAGKLKATVEAGKENKLDFAITR